MTIANGAVKGSSRDASPGIQRGFTLLELMIVVAIVAILASIAIYSYGFATRKGHRAEAQGCLSLRAQYMERFYSTNLRYDQTTAGVDVDPPDCPTDISEWYDEGPVRGFTVAPTATTFTLTFIPKGSQVKDTACGTMTLDQLGRRTPATGCW